MSGQNAAMAGTGALSGAGSGALLGSVVPGIGTAIGAGVGGGLGLASGMMTPTSSGMGVDPSAQLNREQQLNAQLMNPSPLSGQLLQQAALYMPTTKA